MTRSLTFRPLACTSSACKRRWQRCVCRNQHRVVLAAAGLQGPGRATLAMTCFVDLVCMRKPLRVGRVRGVTTIFNALRPCLVIYICVLTIEQLVHTCVVVGDRTPNYTRRIVFHSMICVTAAAGFWRAAKPLSESDVQFTLGSHRNPRHRSLATTGHALSVDPCARPQACLRRPIACCAGFCLQRST